MRERNPIEEEVWFLISMSFINLVIVVTAVGLLTKYFK